MSVAINAFDQVTPAWLTAVLEHAGALDNGSVESFIAQTNERSVAKTARLLVTYSAGASASAPRRLFLKLGTRATEVYFHNQLQPLMAEAPALRCYEAVAGPESSRTHLLFDDIAATHYTPPELISPTQAECKSILDTLARLHAFWWEHPLLPALAQGNNPAAFVRDQAVATFPAFVDFMGDRLSPERRRIYEKLFAGWRPPALTGRIQRGRAVTLTHGDAHPQNFMLANDPGKDHAVGIDWADWRVQPGPGDVAFFIALELYPERRARMEEALIRHYHSRLLEHGVSGYDWEACWQDYRIGVVEALYMPLFWYGWSEPKFWWHTLERSMLAFQDLACEEML